MTDVPDPLTLRDSTQIIVPAEAIEQYRDDLESEFTLTIVEEGDSCRIIASPVVIKEVGGFLARRGISVP